MTRVTADEAQRLHDERVAADPEHDDVTCWCCCWDCDFDFEAVLRESGLWQEDGS